MIIKASTPGGWSANAGRCGPRRRARLEPIGDYLRLTVGLDNAAVAVDQTRDEVLRRSLIGTHLIIEATAPDVEFVSVIDPPADAAEAAATCRQHRCWPVLAGPEGSTDTVLGSPIILYDHPQIAGESTGALFDSTEIDEILTLRVMTMTETEKAEARATDPRAAEIIDRCDALSPEELQRAARDAPRPARRVRERRQRRRHSAPPSAGDDPVRTDLR